MEGKKWLYIGCIGLCCFPLITASWALLLGLLFALTIGNPFQEPSGRWGSVLLRASVVGLGFGINSQVLLEAGRQNIGTTTAFVLGVLGVGFLLAKLLKIDRITGLLVAVGTAICGGSAIAAVGSVMKADAQQLSMSTGVVFLLNAVALFIFPAIGHWAGLSQEQFGTWAAIAIHDTSSVVGAAAKYGDVALQVASITKILRIMWIIPVSLILVIGFADSRDSFKIPLFIVGFVVASCLYSFVPAVRPVSGPIYLVSKQMMVTSLFLIGSGMSIKSLREVGGNVLLQAVVLWVLVSIAALLFVKFS